MARGGSSSSKKRQRKRRPYEDKNKVIASFGCFDTEAAFEEWRQSSFVKPYWDIFVSKFINTDLFRPGKKVADFDNLYAWIREGEKNGRRRFDKDSHFPEYEDEIDWHAWLTHWLVKENKVDREGCFYGSRLENKTLTQTVYHYVLFAKRERARGSKTTTKSQKKKSKTSAARSAKPQSDQSDAESDAEPDAEPDAEQPDPQLGMAVVKWTKGQPSDLPSNATTTTVVESFCGYSLDGFWQEINRRFDLSTHKQRRKALVATKGLSFEDAQNHAAQDDVVVRFSLETEDIVLKEEHEEVGPQEVPAPEGVPEAPTAENRQELYTIMVEEAVSLEATEIDLKCRLWRYNLSLVESKEQHSVDLHNMVLILGGNEVQEAEASEAVQALQYSHDMIESINGTTLSTLNQELNEGNDNTEIGGPPLTKLRTITAEEIQAYREQTKWTDNPAYQRQNHEEACDRLGIPNPEKPRMEGFMKHIFLDAHQPTGINAMVDFEEGCVNGGLCAEDCGLGKTLETLGLLLFRSNERRKKLADGEEVPEARPTLIIMPQNLIAQWLEEICKFTERFRILVYYGPSKKSANPNVYYLKGKGKAARLTRSHDIFNGEECNADTIILTSYSTWAVRHGPKVQWNWLVDKRAKERRISKKEAAAELTSEGVSYKSIDVNCPHQMYGMIHRIILDEGHQIRLQSDEIGWAINHLGATYRHILTGTPTFNGLKEYCGLMEFLQNPALQDENYLRSLGFVDADFAKPASPVFAMGGTCPLDSILIKFNPYTVADDDRRAPLKYCQEAMVKYIFNPIVSPTMAEQGSKMSQVLRKIMLRRTHSSEINGVPLRAALPAVQRLVYDCEFNAAERAFYDAAVAKTSETLFAKTASKKNVEWNTTTYRKLCLLSSWLGFKYLLDDSYKATKLAAKRKKKMTALTILKDMRSGQKRLRVPIDQQIPVDKHTDIETDVQQILHWHCQGAPKLRKLLGILAEIVVLRQEKVLIWVSNPAQAEWLQQVLLLLKFSAFQLRTDLSQTEQDKILNDFNNDPHLVAVLICSYLVSCSGLNMQTLCRTTIEYEPPPNESIRAQEVGRVKRRGQPSPWIRHITLLTKDTFNSKQDSSMILKNLPNLLTQLDLEVWGPKDQGDEDDEAGSHVLGDFVLYNDELLPADDKAVEGKNLKVLGPDDLLYHISMLVTGRKPVGSVVELRKEAHKEGGAAGKAGGGEVEDVDVDPLWI
ncbi:uncharacterized protein J4E84_009868 [Alternaria hordeiaustralica]|uniref:uncharacterized protein n=1 Tax=Alternaria hordeiaustralica TaxID=1187925 RepID=UPI0020C3E3ED|nr:uncharacterized protein J4E84_009868 [Alternaria hordeiaustralica]KAI4675893.1 hypothetical protein J4E84_009868 [Alternaria hordeiaustralica]